MKEIPLSQKSFLDLVNKSKKGTAILIDEPAQVILIGRKKEIELEGQMRHLRKENEGS